MDKVATEMANLSLRSGFQYFVVGARSHADQYTTPIIFSSDTGSDFIYQYLLFEPIMLAKHFDAFSTNNAGLKGIVANLAADLRAGGDKKGAVKSILMRLFRRLYQELTGIENPRFDWKNWARGEPDSHDVLLVGWPLKTPPKSLSNISTFEQMNTIWHATLQRQCKFELVLKTPNTVKTTESAALKELYKQGGTLLMFTDEPQEVESDRPRKRTRSSSHANDDAAESDSCGEHEMPATKASTAHDSGVPPSLSLLGSPSPAPAVGDPSPAATTFTDTTLSLPERQVHRVNDSNTMSYQFQDMYTLPPIKASSTSGMSQTPMTLEDMLRATSGQTGHGLSRYNTPPSPWDGPIPNTTPPLPPSDLGAGTAHGDVSMLDMQGTNLVASVVSWAPAVGGF